MAHVRLEVWALPLGQDAQPLPDLAGWDVSPTDGEDGSVVLTYPENGRNADLLLALADDDVDLEVELTVTAPDGRTWIDRATLDESDVDDVDDQKIITIRGLLLGHIFREVVLPYHPTGENGETPVSGSAGLIVRQLIDAAQDRGCLAGVILDFTDTEDSNGDPWANTGTFRLSPGQTYGAMLGTVRGYQLAEHRLGADRVLHLYNPDGNGVDRTIGSNPLTLEYGRDLGDAPRKWRLRQAITDLVSSGKDGIYSSAANLTARGRRGRRIEGYRSFGNTADVGTLTAITQSSLNTQVNGRTEVSHKVILGPGHPIPLIDFDTADYVFSSTRRGVTRRRVRQITLSGSDDEATSCAVTLGVLIDERAVAQQKRLDDFESGAAVVGTSTPPPDVDDGIPPAAPDDVVATSLWYSSSEGVGLASVTAAWTAVPDSTVVGYVVEWRYLDGALGTAWRQQPEVDGTTHSWSAVVAGAAVRVRVYAVDKFANRSAPSTEYEFVTELDGTPPPVPATPTPYSHLGLLVVPWNGLGAAGEPMPGDFNRVRVHVSTTSNFTPGPATYAGELRAAGELPIDIGAAGYDITHFVKLEAEDRTGNVSAPSAQGSAVLARVADGDIAQLNIGKLTAGILTAIMTVSGIIRTAAAGARVELDAAGLRCIAANGRILFEFSIPASLLTIVGKLIAGVGVGLGATVVIDPADSSLTMYPNATLTRIRTYAFTGTDPGGSSNVAQLRQEVLSSSGASAGPALAMSGTNVWLYHQNGASQSGARLFLGGPGQGNGALLGYLGGGVDASVRVFNNGQVSIVSDNGSPVVLDGGGGDIVFQNADEVRSNIALGTGGQGFSFKVQGLGNAGYRTAFDSGSNVIRFVDNASNTYVSDGTPGGLKSFVIGHPLDDERWLVHGCTEGPTAGVEYHGVADVVEHGAVVELPSYFEAATRVEGRQVQLTVTVPDRPDDVPAVAPIMPALGPASPTVAGPLDHGVIGSPPIPEWARLPVVAASTPRGGRFRITSSQPTCRVAWRVFAIRADVEPFEVEPLRAEHNAHGDGPYRYLTRRTA